MVSAGVRRVAWSTTAVVAVGLLAAGCGASRSAAPTTTKGVPSTTAAPAPSGPVTTAGSTTTLAPATPTTVGIPSSPQPGDQDATQDMVSAWARGDKAGALAVATPAAVATLFAYPYPAGNAVFRGCSQSFPPLVCTFGAPGGGNPNAALIQLYVTEVSAGWYVTSVVIET